MPEAPAHCLPNGQSQQVRQRRYHDEVSGAQCAYTRSTQKGGSRHFGARALRVIILTQLIYTPGRSILLSSGPRTLPVEASPI